MSSRLSSTVATLHKSQSGLPDLFWYSIPKRTKIHQMTTQNIYVLNGDKISTDDCKIYQMAIGIGNTYTNILHSKAHQDVPESEFLV
jgi:hypothetical protein